YIPSRVGNEDTPLILGSDGAGIVDTVGENVTNWKPGDEVIINPALRWDRNSDAPPAGFDILGMPDHGTIAEKIGRASCRERDWSSDVCSSDLIFRVELEMKIHR